jgi:hypothetical protein
MRHPAKWIAPDPFWNSTDPGPGDFLRPRILRFATDTFMEDLFGLLKRDPRGLPALEAEPETWRGPSRRSEEFLQVASTPPSPGLFQSLRRKIVARGAARQIPSTLPGTLKLYQPGHQRHYLVSAALACERPGLPDRSVDRSHNQSVSMLVRKLMAPAGVSDSDFAAGPRFDLRGHLLSGWTEAAFLPGGSPRWVQVDSPEALVDGEERLPLFPSTYLKDDGHCRRLFMGTIPVGRREAYQNAGLGRPVPRAQRKPEDRREELGELLDKLVLGPWKALSESCFDPTGQQPIPEVLAGTDNSDLPVTLDPTNFDMPRLARFRARTQVASWSILTELVEFIASHGKPEVKSALSNGTGDEPALDPIRWVVRQSGLKDVSSYAKDLPAALAAMSKPANQDLLRKMGPSAISQFAFPPLAFGLEFPRTAFPSVLFLLADPAEGIFPGSTGVPVSAIPAPRPSPIMMPLTTIDAELADLRTALLGLVDLGQKTSLPDRIEIPATGGDSWYAVRLVLEHPECVHHDAIFSLPTAPFRMASFFDSDAPVRPVRIGLPVDPTPEGLRKADRNTVFMLSDAMCSQIGRMKGIGFVDLVLSVLPWPFHKDLPSPPPGECKKGDDLGMMLVVSIPIITICALIILIIMVTLLDMVFKWLPFFLFWIPVKAKK